MEDGRRGHESIPVRELLITFEIIETLHNCLSPKKGRKTVQEINSSGETGAGYRRRGEEKDEEKDEVNGQRLSNFL